MKPFADVSHVRGEENYITKEIIEKAFIDLWLTIEKGDTVLFYTGHNRTYPDYANGFSLIPDWTGSHRMVM